jgi:CRISPR-associated endoribonuclease Cas6
MHIAIEFEPVDTRQRILPLNYQYPLSAWIYKTIHEGNHEFADFLHNHGFSSGTRAYKFFTFSMLRFQRGGFKISNDRLEITSGNVWLELSFLIPDALKHFVSGIFQNQRLTLGDKHSQVPFAVKSVQVQPLPVFTECMTFGTLSPLIISKDVTGSRNAQYLKPADGDFERIFFDNLLRKSVAATGAGLINCPDDKLQHDLKLEILSEPKKKGINIKSGTPMQTKVIGYMFDFRLTAPSELIKLGYLAGFGEKNSLGMGCGKCFSTS